MQIICCALYSTCLRTNVRGDVFHRQENELNAGRLSGLHHCAAITHGGRMLSKCFRRFGPEMAKLITLTITYTKANIIILYHGTKLCILNIGGSYHVKSPFFRCLCVESRNDVSYHIYFHVNRKLWWDNTTNVMQWRSTLTKTTI